MAERKRRIRDILFTREDGRETAVVQEPEKEKTEAKEERVKEPGSVRPDLSERAVQQPKREKPGKEPEKELAQETKENAREPQQGANKPDRDVIRTEPAHEKSRYNKDMSEIRKEGQEVDANELLREGVRSGSLSLAKEAVNDFGAVPEVIFDKDDLATMADSTPDMAKFLRSTWSQEASDLDHELGEVTPAIWLDKQLASIPTHKDFL